MSKLDRTRAVPWLALAVCCVGGKGEGGTRDAAGPGPAPAALTGELGTGDGPVSPEGSPNRPGPTAAARADLDSAPAGHPGQAESTGPLSPSLSWLVRGSPPLDPTLPGDLAVGRISVSGGLLGDAEHVVLRMRNGFRACLAQGTDPDQAQGQLTLEVVVAENGSVRTAKATSASGLDPRIAQCVERRAQVATFRPPVGGQARLSIPLSIGSPPDGSRLGYDRNAR